MTEFEDRIRLLGGYLDTAATLLPHARDRFEYFSRLGQEHAALFSVHDRPIQYRWISNPGFIAMAGYTTKGPTVAISYGVPLCILECLEGLFADPHLFVGVGKSTDVRVDQSPPPAHLGRRTRLNQPEPIYWRDCPDPDRSRISHILSEMGYQLVLYHELAHLLCGHAKPSTASYCIDGPLSTPTGRMTERYEEMEADWVAASVSVQQVWSPAFGRTVRSDYPAALIFGLGITLGLLDNVERDVPSSLSQVHPHPIHRLFGLVDSLSITLEQVLGYEVQMVREARQEGLLAVIQSSAAIGLPRGRWDRPDFSEWAFQNYAQERTAFHQFLRGKHGVAELKIGPAKNPIYAVDRLSGAQAVHSTLDTLVVPSTPERT